jgi:large repetitive protein
MLWKESPSFGGYGGWPFYDEFVTPIKLIGLTIRHEQYIDGIQGIYQDQAGRKIYGSWHGGPGGERVVITFDEDEVIRNIYGRSGWFVDQIAFETNKRTYGPFGGPEGKCWQLGEGHYVIGGLFGRSGLYLDRIGFCYTV